jgi:hypothetical protein
MDEMRNVYRILIEKPREGNHLEDLDIDGRLEINLKAFKWIE